jgi:hypothetical protein
MDFNLNGQTCPTCSSSASCLTMSNQALFGLSILFLVIAGVLLLATAYAYLFSTKMRYISPPNHVAVGNIEKIENVEPVKSIELTTIDAAEPPRFEYPVSEEENQTPNNN